jgi:hypothetical protein
MSAILLGVLAEPEAAAEPQRYPKTSYSAPYSQQYKSDYDYCDSRKAPKCAKTGTETFCLKDSEYPEKEVKVSFVLTLIHRIVSLFLSYSFLFSTPSIMTR